MITTTRKSPPTLPGYLFFNPKEIRERPIEFYSRLWKEYGDFVRLPILPNYQMFSVTHPDFAEHVLSTHQERYAKADLVNKPLIMMMGESILTSEGDFWLKHRRLMQPAFHMKQLANLTEVMVRCTESFLKEWENKPDGEVIDIAAETLKLTLKIAGQTLFSKDISDENSVLGQAFRTGFEFINYKMNNMFTEPLWFPSARNRRFHQAKQTLNQLVLDIINSRRENPQESHDLLSMLMATRDEETGEGMSDEQLQNEVITLLVAGHETVASSLAWTWYLLAEYIDITERVQDELETVLNGNYPSFEKLPQLEYTRRVFDETLRLYPPVWGVVRTPRQDDEIQGYSLSKGSLVNVISYLIHRHPDFWSNPNEFNPDNFTPQQINQKPKFSYLPFGGGQRICIGKNFALMEAAIIMAMVLQRFKIELISNQVVELDPTFTLRPKYGIQVRIWKRN